MRIVLIAGFTEEYWKNLNFGQNKMKILFTLIFLMLFIGNEYNSASGVNAEQRPENGATIRLFTDRNLYAAGEEIFFSANLATRDSGESVIYVELITPDGDKIRSGKFKSGMGIASGCLAIPEDLFTGVYYIRAYTREMRNAGPASYEYVPLRIINPLKNDLLISEKEFSGRVSSLPADTGYVLFSGLKPFYGRRDSVIFSVDIEKIPGKEIKNVCITAIPDNTLETHELIIKAENRQDSSVIYYPEPRGISLTGTLLYKDQKTPAADHVVSLSVLGAKDFSSARTDRKGRFFFTLPDDHGKKDIFLSPEDFSGSGMSLFIDNDFCTLPVSLPSPEFKLTEGEKKMVLSMVVNARIRKEFPGPLSVIDSVTRNPRPFYGEPTSTLVMDKFIQLPTLKEYFGEISQEVKVRDRKGKPYFKFFGSAAGMIINDPLVLVDWVVINDIDRVLAISPQKILRIETVNKPYIKGDLTYGGIISIISRDGDFAGIDLPVSGIFVKYDFFSPLCTVKNEVKEAQTPDARNTLLWLPQLNTRENRSTRIVFATGDTPGKYVIVVRGMTSDGHIFSQSAGFEVKR
jgi:hypothetical protein